jgi:plasmid maintenance system killer protein
LKPKREREIEEKVGVGSVRHSFNRGNRAEFITVNVPKQYRLSKKETNRYIVMTTEAAGFTSLKFNKNFKLHNIVLWKPLLLHLIQVK